jgi:hypothetical protein
MASQLGITLLAPRSSNLFPAVLISLVMVGLAEFLQRSYEDAATELSHR